MICKNCKSIIDDNAMFCRFCGSETEVSVKQEILKENNTMRDKVTRFFIPIADRQVLFILTLFLLLLNPIFAAIKSASVSENLTGMNIVSQSYSFFDFLSDMANYIPFIYFLIVLGIGSILFAAFYMLFPLLKNKQYSAKYLILTKTMSIVALVAVILWFIIVFTSNSESYHGIVTVKITLGGWLFILDSIALVITTFRLSAITKKNNKKEMNVA